MAVFERVFTVPRIGAVHREFAEVFALARAVELERRALRLPPSTVGTQTVLRRAYLRFNEELDQVAAQSAAVATAAIRGRIKATQRRPDTKLAPHLAGGIRSRPLNRFGGIATGEVGVADEAALNRVVNPTAPQYGPYWRAQEYGTGVTDPETGVTVPSQVDRVIYGFFYGPGLSGPDRPRSQYAGGGGPHPIFVSAKSQRSIYGSLGFSGGGGSRGGVGGYGTINKEIEGRHFIRDGANQARAEWLRGISRVESDAIAALRPVRP